MENYMMSGEGENNSSDVVYLCDYVDFSTISSAFFILIFILSVTGNVLLLFILAIYENLKNITNLFIVNLACSDLVFALTLPFWATYYLHHWIFGDFTCKFMTAAYFVGLYSSVILLTAMTVDRFITVVLHNWRSSHVRRRRCAMAACAAAWVISIAASVSDAIKVEVKTSWSNVSTCEVSSDSPDIKLGYYLQVSLLFFLPFVIIVFCYSAILKTVLQATNRKRYRTVVVVFCIVAAFFICWGPYNILLFIMSMYDPKDCKEIERLHMAHSICHILALFHCCTNPLLYMLSQKLRTHLFKLLRCKCFRRKCKERGTATTVIQNVAFIVQNSAVTLEPHSRNQN